MRIKLNTVEDRLEIHFDGDSPSTSIDHDKTIKFAPEPGMDAEVLIDVDGFVRFVFVTSLKAIVAELLGKK